MEIFDRPCSKLSVFAYTVSPSLLTPDVRASQVMVAVTTFPFTSTESAGDGRKSLALLLVKLPTTEAPTPQADSQRSEAATSVPVQSSCAVTR